MVDSVDVLSARSASGCAARTDAVLVIVPSRDGLTTIATVALPPAAMEPRAHVSVPVPQALPHEPDEALHPR